MTSEDWTSVLIWTFQLLNSAGIWPDQTNEITKRSQPSCVNIVFVRQTQGLRWGEVWCRFLYFEDEKIHNLKLPPTSTSPLLLPFILQVNLHKAFLMTTTTASVCLGRSRQHSTRRISSLSRPHLTKKSLHVWGATLFSNTAAGQSMESVSGGGGGFRESWGSRWKSVGGLEWRSHCSDGNLYFCQCYTKSH